MSTVRWASETGRSLSHLLKARMARPGGIFSTREFTGKKSKTDWTPWSSSGLYPYRKNPSVWTLFVEWTVKRQSYTWTNHIMWSIQRTSMHSDSVSIFSYQPQSLIFAITIDHENQWFLVPHGLRLPVFVVWWCRSLSRRSLDLGLWHEYHAGVAHGYGPVQGQVGRLGHPAAGGQVQRHAGPVRWSGPWTEAVNMLNTTRTWVVYVRFMGKMNKMMERMVINGPCLRCSQQKWW